MVDQYDPREASHDKKRDKKFRKKFDIVVSGGGKTLAQILINVQRKKKK